MRKFLSVATVSTLRRFGSHVWSGWPEAAYQQETYRQRLRAVQEHFAQSLHQAPAGPVRIISICAGDGRDIIEVLRWHERRGDASAWLVELNRQSVAVGICNVRKARLDDAVHFRNRDATLFATYEDIGPADVLLLCGVWGHVAANERASLVSSVTSLCNTGAAIIWTRGVMHDMARVRNIQTHFSPDRWASVRISLTPDRKWAVATYRYVCSTSDPPQSGTLFNFQRRAGRDELPVPGRRP